MAIQHGLTQKQLEERAKLTGIPLPVKVKAAPADNAAAKKLVAENEALKKENAALLDKIEKMQEKIKHLKDK
jgi:hypothetical protein